jgi:hypothetical protein
VKGAITGSDGNPWRTLDAGRSSDGEAQLRRRRP